MISVDEARDQVRSRAHPIEEMEEAPLAEAAGRVLAVPVRADRDDPPFNRAMMDGYAVRSADTVERNGMSHTSVTAGPSLWKYKRPFFVVSPLAFAVALGDRHVS